jgi:glycerate kinase
LHTNSNISLLSFARLTKEKIPSADENYPGCGAAGGLGFAFMAYLGGRLTSGVELVMAETGLEEKVKESELVITGEGRLDGQTAMGKAPIGVAKLAKKYGKTVIAFSGAETDDARECNEHGIDAFFPILRKISTLEEAMNIENAYKNMADTTEQVMRLYKASGKTL